MKRLIQQRNELALALSVHRHQMQEQSKRPGSVDSAQSLLALGNKVRSFSKAKAGQIAPQGSTFCVRECVESVTAAFAAPAKDKELALSNRIASDVPEIIPGDPARVGQVLGDLIDNAIKFTERGSVCVDIFLENEIEEPASMIDSRICFRVQDTGAGLPETHRAATFTASRLAQQMGGCLKLEGEVGRGSTITFELPLSPSVPLTSNTPEEQGASESSAHSELASLSTALDRISVPSQAASIIDEPVAHP